MDAADVEKLAREAGTRDEGVGQGGAYRELVLHGESDITRFAALVEAAAMERAARLCVSGDADECAAAIRSAAQQG